MDVSFHFGPHQVSYLVHSLLCVLLLLLIYMNTVVMIGTKLCKIEGCTTLVVARSLCNKHGARGTCQFVGCTTGLKSPKESHCKRHGGSKNKPCSMSGCISASARKGLWTKHGGGAGECFFQGCTNKMVSMWKTCITHGGKGYCSKSDCWTPALKYGANTNCRKHTSK